MLHNLCPCFDIAFVQLGVISRTRNKFVEIVAAGECYLITNVVKNKESKKPPFRICLQVKQLADGRMSMKKEKYSSYLTYNIVNSNKIAEKPFS